MRASWPYLVPLNERLGRSARILVESRSSSSGQSGGARQLFEQGKPGLGMTSAHGNLRDLHLDKTLPEYPEVSDSRACQTYLGCFSCCSQPQGVRHTGRQATQPAEGAFPVPIAATARSCRLCLLCSQQTGPGPRATKRPSISPHVLAVAQHQQPKHPRGFLPETLDMVSRLHWPSPASLAPSLARLHLGGQRCVELACFFFSWPSGSASLPLS